VTYYFVASAALGSYRDVVFAVPTGNFGDVFAGYVAKRMGLPIQWLVVATNANDILSRARETALYRMEGVAATTSPSMDIQISSNFERYLFEACGRDPELIRNQMAQLAQARQFNLSEDQMNEAREDFVSDRASEEEVAAAIREVSAASGYLMDTHTACGYVALRKTLREGWTPYVILSTAHPAKFPDAMEQITGERPGLPPRLATLLSDPERTTLLPNDLSAVERFVEENARAIHGAAA
jgi:threonine synthase